MATLLLRLAAPLQAWGADSKFETRKTAREPTKSGVIGLLAAALGLRRDETEPLTRLAQLRFGVRVEREGQLLVDFHMARNEEKDRSYVTYRHYLEDAVFLVGLESEDTALLQELAEALTHPVFPLYLLLLSEEMPDLSGVVEQFGTGAAPESRNYDPLLARITPGSRWQFRLAANPTKSCKDAQKPAARGTVAAHCTTQYQKQWLLDRAAKHGFALTEDSFTVTRVRWHHFAKGGTRPVSLLAVTYEGVLQVTDPEAFRNLLCQGMGRGKAYGLGLLTVMRGG